VRKGAPADLGRFARIVGNQQKLVKKVNIEPPKIFRVKYKFVLTNEYIQPPVNEDKEKAPKIKSPLEPNRLSLKKLPSKLN